MDPGLDDEDVCSYQAICVGGHLTDRNATDQE